MDLKGQLPYLGEEQEDGTLKIGEHITIDIRDWFRFRPDFKRFKSVKYQSEDICVAVLTGISCFEECESQMLEIEQMAIKEIIGNVSLQSPIFKEWNEFTSIKRSLKELIMHGKSSKNLCDRYTLEDEDEVLLYNSRVFKPYSYLNGLQFMQWAENNNFKIPDELKFGEHENGELYWLDEENSTVVETTENDIEKQLDQELHKICPEVEIYYNALKEEVEIADTSSASINAIKQSDLHQLSLDYYERKKNEYKYITKELVSDEIIYNFSQQRRRMFIGSILQKYLKIQSHPAVNSEIINTSKEGLRIRHNKIIKLP